MTTSLMMKDIPITNNEYSSYNDDYLVGTILDNYYEFGRTNISFGSLSTFWILRMKILKILKMKQMIIII